MEGRGFRLPEVARARMEKLACEPPPFHSFQEVFGEGLTAEALVVLEEWEVAKLGWSALGGAERGAAVVNPPERWDPRKSRGTERGAPSDPQGCSKLSVTGVCTQALSSWNNHVSRPPGANDRNDVGLPWTLT